MQPPLATTPPSDQFAHSVAANVHYWQKRTKELTHHNLPGLDRDRQNLYRAARYGLHLAETWQETAELILQSFILIEKRGYWNEWIPILERALEKCPADDFTLRGRILDYLGISYRLNRQLAEAYDTHCEELRIGETSQDQWRIAHASINLAAVCRCMRRFPEAEKHLSSAKNAFLAIEAPLEKQAFVKYESGLLAQDQEHWPEAEAHLHDSIALWREVDNPGYLVSSLKQLGLVLAAQNKNEPALKAYREALSKINPAEHNLDYSKIMNDMGILYFNQGSFDEALRHFLAANSSYLRQSDNLFDQAIINANLGNVYQAKGRLDEAERAFRTSKTLWETVGDRLQLANSVCGLAEVKLAQGEIAQAQKFARQGVALLAAYPDDVWAQKIQKNLGKVTAACAAAATP